MMQTLLAGILSGLSLIPTTHTSSAYTHGRINQLCSWNVVLNTPDSGIAFHGRLNNQKQCVAMAAYFTGVDRLGGRIRGAIQPTDNGKFVMIFEGANLNGQSRDNDSFRQAFLTVPRTISRGSGRITNASLH